MSANQAAAPARPVTKATAAAPKALPVRRRWGRVAAGALLALGGGLVSAQLYLTAGDRVEVVVLSADVPRYGEITGDDVSTTRVAADPGVDVVPAGQMDELIGRRAAYDLVEGTLLPAQALHPEGEPLAREDESVIPVELPSSQVATSVLHEGGRVRVVMGGSSTDNREVEAWVLRVGDSRDDARRTRSLEIVVPRSYGADVALAARNGDISLVVDGEV